MYCNHCGTHINESDTHCHLCGLKPNAETNDFEKFTDDLLELEDNKKRHIRRWTKAAGIILLVLLGVAFIGTIVYELLGKYDLQKVNGSDVLSVTFGITSGLLTLVGLISIFISINSQHTIQRCRELLWEITEQPYLSWTKHGHFDYDYSIEQNVRERLVAYKQVLNGGRLFNHFVVVFVFVVITVVSSVLVSTLKVLQTAYFKPYPSETTFLWHATLIGVLFMFCFGSLALSLSRITLIGGLPRVEDVIDANSTKAGVPALFLACMMVRVTPVKALHLRVSFPFRNLKIHPWITAKQKAEFGGENITLIGTPFMDSSERVHLKRYRTNGNAILFLIDRNFEKGSFEWIHYSLEMTSKQGTIYVEFHETVDENPNNRVLYPTHIIPHLQIESELFEKSGR